MEAKRGRGGLVSGSRFDGTNAPVRAGWRLILGTETADGPTNMALDQALLESVAAGAAPTLRLYRWAPATLSFGRNQPARGLYDRAAAAERGIAFVRRPTGGQAVLHDDELTYAVVATVDEIGKPRAAYARINEALVAGLDAFGLTASLAEPGPGAPARSGGCADAPRPTGGGGERWRAACFRRPERGEVVVGGAKLVGSAQRMESRTILQHGSILIGGSQAAAEALLLDEARPPAAAAGPGWTTLERELGERPDPDALAAALVEGFETVLGCRLESAELTAPEATAAGSWTRRFASEAWTWRR